MNPHRYTVQDNNLGFHVVVEVDRDVLTTDLALEINNFWGGSRSRLDSSGGNVEVAVVRYFARAAIATMLADGGADFDDKTGPGRALGAIWTKDLNSSEGWPGEECLKVVEAYVFISEFEDLEAIAQ